MLSNPFQCPDCRSGEAYRSRYRDLAEKLVLTALLLRPVRCGGCCGRFYMSWLVRAGKRDELQMVTRVMASGASALHGPPPPLYTEDNSSGSGPVS